MIRKFVFFPRIDLNLQELMHEGDFQCDSIKLICFGRCEGTQWPKPVEPDLGIFFYQKNQVCGTELQPKHILH